VIITISISPEGRRRARLAAKKARDRKHVPRGQRVAADPPAEDSGQFIGRSQEIHRGKRYVIIIEGDKQAFENFPPAN
jgi:hypothetical protein